MTEDRAYLDAVIAQSKQRLARIMELEDALQTIADTNGAQGVLAVNVAKRALGDPHISPTHDPAEPMKGPPDGN